MELLNPNKSEMFTSKVTRCTECFSSQIKSLSRTHKKTRRSNSYPGIQKDYDRNTNEQLSTRKVIIKRWHSQHAIHQTAINTANSLPTTAVTEPRSTSDPTSSPSSWLSINSNSSISYSFSFSKRVASLFIFGVMLIIVLNLLQKQKGVTIFSPGMFGDVLNSAWWMPPLSGIAAIVVGLLYPKLDQLLGNHSKLNYEWSSVMRCIAVFVGINHASAKLAFDSNIHLSITLAMLSFGLWYFFDQSLSGLGLGLAITGVATTVTQFLVAMDAFGYSNPDFLYMQSWVPCLFFSGGVTVGAVGRALAAFEYDAVKQHME